MKKDKILLRRRCVVTGYGAICSLGNDVNQIWDSLMRQTLGYKYYDLSEYNISSKFFGRVELPLITADLTMQRTQAREGLMVLHAASEAIKHAFPTVQLSSVYPSESTGVVIGSGWAGSDASIECGILHKRKNSALPFSNLKSMPSSAATACAINYNLRGYQSTVMAACASGSMAIGQAFREIQRGTVDMMLAGGVEALQQPASIWSIDILQALSKEQRYPGLASCPFSANRSGFVLSEGAAVLVLEEYESAKRRNAVILGEVLGYGYQCDAVSFIGLGDCVLSRARSIDLALSDSGLDKNQIRYINAHGTSTQSNDLHETRTIKSVFGKQAYNIPISSTKSYTGHLIGASGALESIFCLKSMSTGIVPGTINMTISDPLCDLNYLPNNHLKVSPEYCLNLNSGFGGHNSALIIGALQ
ncbi:UNVERIFIED_ORG: 3-oxoacyl-[acyl-carrier-protein] synthase II [Buttiauxella agrestis ATCC 33320]